MRGTISPGHKWDVMVDLFFYRDPEEAKEQEEEAPVAAEYGAPVPDYIANEQWNQEFGVAPAVLPAGAGAGAGADWAPAPVPVAGDGWDTAAAPTMGLAPVATGWDAAPDPDGPPAATGWE